nr:MAG TPA: hypothetical protein [Caudoviricetes sp.]
MAPVGFLQITGQFHLCHNKFSVNYFYICVVGQIAQRPCAANADANYGISDAASGIGHWAGSGCLNSHGIFPCKFFRWVRH